MNTKYNKKRIIDFYCGVFLYRLICALYTGLGSSVGERLGRSLAVLGVEDDLSLLTALDVVV